MSLVRSAVLAALVVGAVLLTTRPAAAEGVFHYRGPHAVPSEYGGFCNLSVRHFHTYKPDDPKVFRYDDNTYIFIGDPVAHGYAGPRLSFYGHHPIAAGWGGGWCYLGGPHFHWYRPTDVHFSFHGGAYYWAGGFTDPWYIRHRRIYEPIFASYYIGRPGYIRPLIYAAPPRFYVGPRMTVPVARWNGPYVRAGVGVRVGAPGVRMGGPGVRVGAPGVRIGGPMGGPVRAGVGPVGAPGRGPMVAPGRGPMAAPGRGPMAAPGRGPVGMPGRGPGMAPAQGQGPGMGMSRGPGGPGMGRGPGVAPAPGRGGMGMGPGPSRSPTPRMAPPSRGPSPSPGRRR